MDALWAPTSVWEAEGIGFFVATSPTFIVGELVYLSAATVRYAGENPPMRELGSHAVGRHLEECHTTTTHHKSIRSLKTSLDSIASEPQNPCFFVILAKITHNNTACPITSHLPGSSHTAFHLWRTSCGPHARLGRDVQELAHLFSSEAMERGRPKHIGSDRRQVRFRRRFELIGWYGSVIWVFSFLW